MMGRKLVMSTVVVLLGALVVLMMRVLFLSSRMMSSPFLMPCFLVHVLGSETRSEFWPSLITFLFTEWEKGLFYKRLPKKHIRIR